MECEYRFSTEVAFENRVLKHLCQALSLSSKSETSFVWVTFPVFASFIDLASDALGVFSSMIVTNGWVFRYSTSFFAPIDLSLITIVVIA